VDSKKVSFHHHSGKQRKIVYASKMSRIQKRVLQVLNHKSIRMRLRN